MLVSSLASGSEGNSVYININNKHILIDMGMNYKYIKEKLGEMNVSPNLIDYVLITHTHSDHIAALETFINKHHPYIMVDEKMLPELKCLEDYPNLIFESTFKDDMIEIDSFKTSHDAVGSRGYIVKNNDESVVYITDTGYINHKLFDKLTNHSLYVFEANHNVEMLMHGRYPSFLKARIRGDKGHLSNNQASFYLSKFIGDKTKAIMLAHLSKENNDPELCINEIRDSLLEDGISFDNFFVCKQNERVDYEL